MMRLNVLVFDVVVWEIMRLNCMMLLVLMRMEDVFLLILSSGLMMLIRVEFIVVFEVWFSVVMLVMLLLLLEFVVMLIM